MATVLETLFPNGDFTSLSTLHLVELGDFAKGNGAANPLNLSLELFQAWEDAQSGTRDYSASTKTALDAVVKDVIGYAGKAKGGELKNKILEAWVQASPAYGVGI